MERLPESSVNLRTVLNGSQTQGNRRQRGATSSGSGRSRRTPRSRRAVQRMKRTNTLLQQAATEFVRGFRASQQLPQQVAPNSSSQVVVSVRRPKRTVRHFGVQTSPSLPFTDLFHGLSSGIHRLEPRNLTTFHVRIGQGQAYAGSTIRALPAVEHVATTATLMTALEEAYCHLKEQYIREGQNFFNEILSIGSCPIRLNPYQALNIYGINTAQVKSEKIRFLPMTPCQVIRSCIRTSNRRRIPLKTFFETRSHLWSHISSPNGYVLIDVPRFMSCWLDASIFALLAAYDIPNFWRQEEIDDYIRKRILQRLLLQPDGSNSSHYTITEEILGKIHLDYGQIHHTIPQVDSTQEVRFRFQQFLDICDIRPGLTLGEMPPYPLLETVEDFTDVDNYTRELLRGEFNEYQLVSTLENPRTSLPLLMTPINHQCIANAITGANSKIDLFEALSKSKLVSPQEADDDAFEARSGPPELVQHDQYLNFCLATDRFITSETSCEPNLVGSGQRIQILYGTKGEFSFN